MLTRAALRPVRLSAYHTPTADAFTRMDAHRQTFHALVNALTTYRPVMLRVKQAYDAMLDRATASMQLHKQLSAKLTVARTAISKCQTHPGSASKHAAAEMEQQLLLSSAAAGQAEAQARAAEAAVSDAAGRLRSMQRQVQDLKQDIARLRMGMLASCSWRSPTARKGLGTGRNVAKQSVAR